MQRVLRLFARVLRLAVGYLLLCIVLALSSPLVSPRCPDISTPRDIAVVLGGGASDEALNPETQARVAGGVALHQRGMAAALHMTGGGSVGDALSIGEAMAQAAIRQGVPAESVTWEGQSRSTLQNALFSVPLLPEDAALVVVTQPFHSLRGAASFAWAGRPSAFCAVPYDAAHAAFRLRDPLWEIAGWGLNLPRAILYRAARLLRFEHYLSTEFLS